MTVKCPSRRTAWVLSLVVTVFVGCQTTIVSKPLREPATTASESGVIYQLTKPAFKVVRTPPTTEAPAKYSLVLSMVADPERRYGLSIKPGKISKVDLTVTLGNNGSIVAMTADAKEQLTPTIKSIGEFAGSVLGGITGLSAAGLLKTAAEGADGKAFGVDPSLRTGPPSAFARSVDELCCRLAERSRDATKTDEERQLARSILEAVKACQRPAKDGVPFASAASDFRSKLRVTLRGSAARSLLADAARPNATTERLQFAKRAYEEERNAIDAQIAQATVTLWDEWQLVRAEIASAVRSDDLERLLAFGRRVHVVLGVDADPALTPEALALLRDCSRDLAARAADFALVRSNLRALLADLAVAPTSARLRYERAGELIKNTQEHWTAWVSTPPERPAIAQKIRESQRELFEVVGAHVEYLAMRNLEAILQARPPSPAEAGHSSPLTELAAARTQWQALQADYAIKLAQLAAEAADKPELKKDVWGEENAVEALTWNVQAMSVHCSKPCQKDDSCAPGPRRLLVDPDASPGESDDVVAFVRTKRGNDPEAWPKFVVKIEKERP